MYPPRRAVEPSPAAPRAPAALGGDLALVGTRFVPSHKALTKSERESLSYFAGRRGAGVDGGEPSIDGADNGAPQDHHVGNAWGRRTTKNAETGDAVETGAKSWLQAHGILFRGLTPKRTGEHSGDSASLPGDHAARSPGFEDRLTPSSVHGSPDKLSAEEEPGATPVPVAGNVWSQARIERGSPVRDPDVAATDLSLSPSTAHASDSNSRLPLDRALTRLPVLPQSLS